jgi:prevent-host-death family protein
MGGEGTMAKISTSAARQQFAEIVSKAEFGGERTVLHRHKKPVAAVVPIEDLELLERYEDELDAKLAKRARREKTVAWEHLKKDLGL